MATFKLNGEGPDIPLDKSLPFELGVELERQVKIGHARVMTEVGEGTNRGYTALYWICVVKHEAARTGAGLRDTALALPYAAFERQIDLGTTYASIVQDPEPEPDPTTPEPDGSTGSACPGTSGPFTLPASNGTANGTSASSHTTSASGRGSGGTSRSAKSSR